MTNRSCAGAARVAAGPTGGARGGRTKRTAKTRMAARSVINRSVTAAGAGRGRKSPQSNSGGGGVVSNPGRPGGVGKRGGPVVVIVLPVGPGQPEFQARPGDRAAPGGRADHTLEHGPAAHLRPERRVRRVEGTH